MKLSRTQKILVEAAGATLGNTHVAYSRSDYTRLRQGSRSVELRGSDHLNFANPTTAATARKAYQLRYTARGFDRALALWLGWSEDQLRGLNLSTLRDCRRLASMPRELAGETSVAAESLPEISSV